MNNLPEFLTGEKLPEKLFNRPKYNRNIRDKSNSERLPQLSNLYKIYVPNQMSVEIYSKLYLSLMHSIDKKRTKQSVLQMHENKRAITGNTHHGIIGGADSFTIIGSSGIGKSTAIQRAVGLISENNILDMPESKVIPFVTVQCPFDCSVKGLLLDILLSVDTVLNTNYYANAVKARATIDMLIGSVSQVAINHIGVLIVDEIQNAANSRLGDKLVGMLTQLINSSGISICMVGTPEASDFFERRFYLARRTIGLKYQTMNYDEEFCSFCREIWAYQYTQKQSDITPGILQWLYEHSRGVTSVVVSLIHDAQEIAIIQGAEGINMDTLNAAYENRHQMLHLHINQPKISLPVVRKQYKKAAIDMHENQNSISGTLNLSKELGVDFVSLLKKKISVEVVRI